MASRLLARAFGHSSTHVGVCRATRLSQDVEVRQKTCKLKVFRRDEIPVPDTTKSPARSIGKGQKNRSQIAAAAGKMRKRTLAEPTHLDPVRSACLIEV